MFCLVSGTRIAIVLLMTLWMSSHSTMPTNQEQEPESSTLNRHAVLLNPGNNSKTSYCKVSLQLSGITVAVFMNKFENCLIEYNIYAKFVLIQLDKI